MHILFSTDHNYIMPTGILMRSICINNPDENINFHIIVSQGFEQSDQEILQNIADEHHCDCNFYTIQEKDKDLPLGREGMPGRITIETYYRLFITELLPDDIHKIIYLDGDMICRKSLRKLWDTNLDDMPIGAVHDMDETLHLGTKRLPYMPSDGYFNAGMLLINVDYWREHHALDTFLNIIKERSECIVFHDQDILNMAFHDKKVWLPLTYNFQNGFLFPESERKCVPEIVDEIESTMQDPAIIHYCTGVKPWNVCCTHPQRWVWRYYKSLSLWKNRKLDVPKVTSLHQFIKNWAFRLGLQENNTTLYRKIILKK